MEWDSSMHLEDWNTGLRQQMALRVPAKKSSVRSFGLSQCSIGCVWYLWHHKPYVRVLCGWKSKRVTKWQSPRTESVQNRIWQHSQPRVKRDDGKLLFCSVFKNRFTNHIWSSTAEASIRNLLYRHQKPAVSLSVWQLNRGRLAWCQGVIDCSTGPLPWLE